jgi:hypothetical protein
VVLLPVFMGLAVAIMLYILRRERHERALGTGAPRPLYVNMVLGVFFAFVGLMIIANVVGASTKTARP